MSVVAARPKAAIVLGTRPEIIKLAPLLHELGNQAVVLHTGQHWDESLSRSFFSEFGLPIPKTLVGVGGLPRGQQIGKAVLAIDKSLSEENFGVVVVQGDTNSALAGAIAANGRGLALIHVEAGLRSFDRAMPEEHNRVVIDHLSDICCAPTPVNVDNLMSEGVGQERIRLTGNPIVEALAILEPTRKEAEDVYDKFRVRKDRYALATFHRPENVDSVSALRRILEALSTLGVEVLCPIHPRTRARMESFGMAGANLSPNIRLLNPVDYRTFLALQKGAILIISDSGGVQEEVTILRRPLLVVRNSTERPESLLHFARLASPFQDLSDAMAAALRDAPDWCSRLAELDSPYGDGLASSKIYALISKLLDS